MSAQFRAKVMRLIAIRARLLVTRAEQAVRAFPGTTTFQAISLGYHQRTLPQTAG